MSESRGQRRALAVACALCAACQTQAPEQAAERPPEQHGSGESQSVETHDVPTPQQPSGGTRAPDTLGTLGTPDLPVALAEAAVGEFTPASWLDGAERVAIVTHAGHVFIAAAGTGWLQIFDIDRGAGGSAARAVARVDAPGAAHALEVVGTDDRGRTVLALGRGIGRDARTAGLSVVVHRFDGRALTLAESIPLPPSARAQVVGIATPAKAIGRAAGGLQMWLGAFESKYLMALYSVVQGPDGAFVATAVDRIRVPLGLALGDPDQDGESDLFIARPYGDDKDQPGDVFRWHHGGERERLPSTRGARAVLVHGRDVIMADGWHKDYGRQAAALLTRVRRDDNGWHADILVRVAGRHGYDRLRVGNLDGDSEPDLVAAGNGPAVLVQNLQAVSGVAPTLGTQEAWDIAIGDLLSDAPGQPRDEVIIAGPIPGIWRLR